MQLRVHTATFPTQWIMEIRNQVPNVTGYLPGDITWPSKSTMWKKISCILQCWDLLPTWYHVYQSQHTFMFTLQGTWPGPCCWASWIQLRLVGFSNNRQRLLQLREKARLHVTDYNDYSPDSTPTIGLIDSRRRLLDFVKNARRHAGDYSFRLQD
jgi:hypothetical protein